MNAFHLEVRVFHELVQETQVYHRSEGSTLFGDQEQATEETFSYGGDFYNGPPDEEVLHL